MAFSKTRLIGDRAAHKPRMVSDYFLKRHIRSVQAYRREYDCTVPSGRFKIYNVTPDGSKVPSTFLGLVQREVVDLLPFLREGQTYSVNDLLGLQFLRALNGGERRMVDKCIAILISWGLSMQMVQTPADQPSSYRFLGLRINQEGQK